MPKEILSTFSRFLFTGILPFGSVLTHLRSVLPSYRNQSHAVKVKSVDWFLYYGNVDLN